ncbi:D-arabinono-1,4-lactone oxidase [Chitinophaga polysaccharea]|uniref:D-arabinono-1,4-lactone oxidase n=1 Tax=Chitinophaga polysaccharea TaxID=1293035 RepID=A0A561PVX3_9BACT|nr:FAD-binding protein [Chitinophaga polysaccharea]TWF42257.1 D-arabinono-1,4-lactone oxidase [Chitinophaga polysaccharea]
MKIVKHGSSPWSNMHNTFTQQVTDLYDLANEVTGTALQNYNDTTSGIQQIIKNAIQSNTSLRTLGGSWSFSPIASTKGILLNTKPLNIRFTINSNSTAATYTGDAKRLCLAQCGNAIWELNDFLHQRGLSLSACGASNGQTIAGAIATGTHGAAIGFGAVQEGVVGLHIITGPDKHIWLERASYPVMADSFANKLGAAMVRDDDAFNAAVVSFGAFGFIHGVMIEAEDDYLLEYYLRRVPYDDALIHQLTTLDFTYPHLPYPNVTPFHFQSLINPYDLNKGAYMTTMYKRPYRNDYTKPKPNGAGIGPGDDAPCFIGKLAGVLPAAVPLLVNKVLAASLTLREQQYGRLGEIFNNTTLRGKVSSAAVGLPVSVVDKVITGLLQVNKTDGPFAGLFAFRFVKASKATMAFTHFAPVTCVLELDGVLSPETTHFYEAVWNMLDQLNIPFTFHWGKMNTLTPTRVRQMYGANLDQFLAARARIVDPEMLRIFSNDAMKEWGIDEV